MPKSAVVSFRITRGQYAILNAMADAQGRSLSALVRGTVVEALDLDRQLRVLVFLLRAGDGWDGRPGDDRYPIASP
jgi:hypothetical protein